MRLIDADKLIAKYPDARDFCRRISEAPTVDAEPVRWGEWISEEDDYFDKYICSRCGIVKWTRKRYCPECGARMKGAYNHTQAQEKEGQNGEAR